MHHAQHAPSPHSWSSYPSTGLSASQSRMRLRSAWPSALSPSCRSLACSTSDGSDSKSTHTTPGTAGTTRVGRSTVWQHPVTPAAVAGIGSGIVSGIACAPLDVLRVRLQVQRVHGTSTGPRPTVIAGLADVYAADGIRGWFTGLPVYCVASTCSWAVYFTAYHWAKLQLAQNDSWATHRAATRFSSAYVASMASSIFTNPLWISKIRIQTRAILQPQHAHGDSLGSTLRLLWKNEGFRGLGRGMSLSLVGSLHASIHMCLYETLKDAFAHSEEGMPRNVASSSGADDLTWLQLVAATVLSKVVVGVSLYPHEVIRSRLQTQSHSMSGVPDTVIATCRASTSLSQVLVPRCCHLTRAGPLICHVTPRRSARDCV